MNPISTPGNIPSDLVADWQTLHRVFIRPEDEKSRQTLIKYMEQILFGLHEFLNSHVGVTEAIPLATLAKSYTDTTIRREPEKKLADVIKDIINEIAPRAVNVASPYFIGHMTSAIPFFMVHLKAITAALNQNLIKLETSKVLSVLEKQVLAKVHRMVYNREPAFYDTHVQNVDTCLGLFTNGGTTANITALWAARNRLCGPTNDFAGLAIEGLPRALEYLNCTGLAIMVSRRGHYSLGKAADLLGIGRKQLILVDTDVNNRIDMESLREEYDRLQQQNIRVLALVGIAGTTETGHIDPLEEMADFAAEVGCYFHVDAAWGGPTLFSDTHRHLLRGIERAVTIIDCHKQSEMMPMSAGMVFR